MSSFLSWLLKPKPVEVSNTPSTVKAPLPVGSAPDFNECFDRLIDHEGGFTAHREDRGNWTSGIIGKGQLNGTKYGISAMSYPTLDIRNLTLEQAKRIYYEDFWLRAKAQGYDGAIGYQVFDAAVNHGIGNAIRFLQRAVNVADDGSVGQITLDAIKAHSVTDVLMRFNAERIKFYTKLSTWPTFGKGWVLRVAGNLEYGAKDA